MGLLRVTRGADEALIRQSWLPTWVAAGWSDGNGHAVSQKPAEPASSDAYDLDAMSLDDLHELARQRGVEVHHRSGADKVRAELRAAGVGA